jgi:hypothetical protein
MPEIDTLLNAKEDFGNAAKHALGAHAPGQAAWGGVRVSLYRAGQACRSNL